MSGLTQNWITEKHIDFEYKKYVLLAYLQEVKKNFDSIRLYPWLGELIEHYRNVVAVRENKQTLQKNFPQRLTGLDAPSVRLTYESLVNDDELMTEIENIIEFAIPQFQQHVEEGRSIYDIAEEHMHLQPVGVMPLKPDHGYLLLKGGDGSAQTTAYQYQVTLFENASQRYKAIHTHCIGIYEKNISTTYQSIKNDLIRENAAWPNPAAYAVETEMVLPLEETFLPIAKRLLVRHISAALA